MQEAYWMQQTNSSNKPKASRAVGLVFNGRCGFNRPLKINDPHSPDPYPSLRLKVS